MTPAQKRAAIVAVLLFALLAAGFTLTAIWTLDERWAQTAVVFGALGIFVGVGGWLAEQ